MTIKHLSAYLIAAFLSLFLIQSVSAIQLSGTTDIHDPSTIVRDGDRFWTFGTGGGANNFPINALYSYDLINWQRAPSPIPPNTRPGWVNGKVPGFDGNFWAPDIIQMNGRYYLYYSAFSATSGMNSAIGVMVTDSLNNPNWQDLGMVVSTMDEPRSASGEPVNAIDAGVFRDANNNVWIVYGSHYAGIYMTQINPATGLRMNSSRHGVVGNNGNWHEFEAAQVQYIDGYYYMFVNLGECCAGNQSTYYIVVGRSTSPTGPYLDKNGRSLWNYGGSTILSTSGNYIGPGHFGYLNNNGQHLASIHYYDGTTATGWPGRLDLLQINMSNGWPSLTRNFTLNAIDEPNEPPPAVQVPVGRAVITSRLSGKALEVENASQDDGANVIQWTYNGIPNQQWDIADAGNGYYTIRAAHSGKSLDVYNFSTEEGGEIRQWSFTGGANQRWRFVDAGNGYYGIVSQHSGLGLDVFEFSTADGGDIRQWTYWGGENQQWQLQYINTNNNSPASITLEEATGFCSVDGAIETEHAGYGGSGFANTTNANGAGINWRVNVPAAGQYQLRWRYANGTSSARSGRVLVNSAQQVASVALNGTGAWNSYTNSATVTVNLAQGVNTIRLEATSSGGLANIDHLQITGVQPTPVSCN